MDYPDHRRCEPAGPGRGRSRWKATGCASWMKRPSKRRADGDAFEGSLLDHDAVWRAVRGMDAVIHTGEPPQDLCPNPS